jgi:general secretion pathway protein D
MKWSALSICFAFFIPVSVFAGPDTKMKMYFNNEEIIKIIEKYSKASGQKFVVDPGVRGRVSIFNQDEVTVEEAFNQLSSALAINGFAISKQGDTMVVKSGRNIQRDLIEVSTQQPSLKPERMYSWIYTFKYISAESVNRDLRILPSKDGEMNVHPATNQIIFSDWTSNLNRIAEVLKEVDKKPEPEVAKIIEASKREHRPPPMKVLMPVPPPKMEKQKTEEATTK